MIERPDRVNWSTLKSIGLSPKHYLHRLATPRTDSEALQLGRVTHCAVFEPDVLNDRYTVAPRFNRAMNDETAIAKGYDGGKQAAAAFEARMADAKTETVAPDIYLRATSMRTALLADPVARPIITSGYAEHKIEWLDTKTGIECRGTVDHVNGCLSDLKTTRSLVTCERDIARFGYHAQLAWYADGLAAAGIATEKQPCIIFVESVAPYDVLVLRFDDDDLAVGRRVYRSYLERLGECRWTGVWPGIGGGAERRVVLPPWADPLIEDMEVVIDGKAVAL